MLEGVIQSWLSEDGELEKLCFKKVRSWSHSDVDNVRVAWKLDVFKSILASVGEFLCADDNTRSRVKMDNARLLVKTKESKAVLEDIEAIINYSSFTMRIVEDSHNPPRTQILDLVESKYSTKSKSEDETKFWQDDDVQEEEGDITCSLEGSSEKRDFLEGILAKHDLTISQKGFKVGGDKAVINVEIRRLEARDNDEKVQKDWNKSGSP
ncbi:hypothetical protein KIW84_033177 [Lathyrus oleraceus]|uniref:Uncharacterized protein n=1 Tax=Pisum sativum TaxID=3888 RepID=A0A9D5B2R5_PEA|nr:hypothetical protein KIW84_033177 [Pisum sativum]